MDSGMIDDKESEYYYAHGGKIMLTTVVILFLITITLLALHLVIRWYLLRHRNRQQHLRRSRHLRRQSFVFYFDNDIPTSLTLAVSRGLDPAVISSLPVFKFSSETLPGEAVDCAVCLSEFEEGETGRVLPKCNHSFHIDCIDMWFHSHSTCPLCRTSVELLPVQVNQPEVTIDVCEPEMVLGSSFGEESNRSTEPEISSSSLCSTEKQSSLLGVTVKVPGTNECESSSSYLSPMSRVLSFTRILSRERKSSVSATSDCVVELDAERVGREETH